MQQLKYLLIFLSIRKCSYFGCIAAIVIVLRYGNAGVTGKHIDDLQDETTIYSPFRFSLCKFLWADTKHR